MGKFANDIMNVMRTLTRNLETTLGPDTGDLALRIGLHSGSVTAGVLRGDRARFQLFGDTMNTAARMEQTGMQNKIQVSQTTADSLVAGGKRYGCDIIISSRCICIVLNVMSFFIVSISHWLRLRDEKIVAKGKGEMVTYWLDVKSNSHGSKSSCSSRSGADSNHEVAEADGNCSRHELREAYNQKSKTIGAEKIDRLVDWNTDNLLRLLQQIVDSRQSSTDAPSSCIDISFKANPFDEVKEIIALPQEKRSKHVTADALIPVSTEVSGQLRDYISKIAQMYNGNYFHNFEHVRFYLSLSVIFLVE